MAKIQSLVEKNNSKKYFSVEKQDGRSKKFPSMQESHPAADIFELLSEKRLFEEIYPSTHRIPGT